MGQLHCEKGWSYSKEDPISVLEQVRPIYIYFPVCISGIIKYCANVGTSMISRTHCKLIICVQAVA